MKKEYIILAAIIIVLSLYLVMRNPDKTYQLPDMPKVAKDAITKIEIVKPDNSIILTREDDKWRIMSQEYPADMSKVNSMLDVIDKFTLTAMVSESKNYTLYDLGDDKKISVKAWNDKTLAREFFMGKPAPTNQHTFVRVANDERVYYAAENFRNTFDQPVDNLRDKTALVFEKNDIQEIKIAKNQTTLTLIKKQVPIEIQPETEKQESQDTPPPAEEPKTTWESSDGKEVSEKDLNSLLATLSSLRCESYPDIQKKEAIKESPLCTIHLTGTAEHELSIFAKTKEDAKEYLSVSSGNDYPFLLSGWKVDDRIMKPVNVILHQPEAKKAEVKKPGKPKPAK